MDATKMGVFTDYYDISFTVFGNRKIRIKKPNILYFKAGGYRRDTYGGSTIDSFVTTLNVVGNVTITTLGEALSFDYIIFELSYILVVD